MIYLEYTNEYNKTITINQTGNYKLLDIQGLGKVDAEIQTVKAPFQDGTTHIDTLLNNRYLTIELMILANNTEELINLKRNISNIFNPKLKNNLLKVVINGVTFEIPTTPESTVDFPTGEENVSSTFQRVMINLVCTNPFWLSDKVQTQPMANWIGGFSFPLSFLGSNIGFSERGTKVDVYNDGDVSAPIEIVFSGVAVNPVIKNLTTGEFIKVNRT